MAAKPNPVLDRYAQRGQPYGLSTAVTAPELPARAGALPERLQDIARNYLGARRQSGMSLLEAARWLSEARQEAQHGEWAIFLEAIGLDESRARAQIRIHEEAQRDPMFADRIVNGFLSEAVARELLPAPKEVREEVLARETPPTLQDVREAKRALTPDLSTDTPADLKAAGVQLVKHGAWYQATGYSGEMNGWTNPAAPYAQAVEQARAEIAKRQKPSPPEVAPTRLTCPTCGEVIVNGIWGELNECGSCYHARQQAPAAPVPPTAGSPEAASGSGETITVQTNQGPREIVPTRANGVLAWHTSLTTGGRYAITHIPSGKRIAQFMYESRVEQALDQLSQLDWSTVAPDGAMQPQMALQVARVLVQFDDVDQYVARQTRLKELEALEAQAEQAEMAPPEAAEIAPIDWDDAAYQAAIREKAKALGLELTWETDDRVTLFWPGEDIEQIDPMYYGHALKWLDSEAVGLSLHRAELHPAAPRRLTPGAHAQAMTLLSSIRTDLITDQIEQAERRARQLLVIIEKGEAED